MASHQQIWASPDPLLTLAYNRQSCHPTKILLLSRLLCENHLSLRPLIGSLHYLVGLQGKSRHGLTNGSSGRFGHNFTYGEQELQLNRRRYNKNCYWKISAMKNFWSRERSILTTYNRSRYQLATKLSGVVYCYHGLVTISRYYMAPSTLLECT